MQRTAGDFEVDSLAGPCHSAMRSVAFIAQSSVIDQILTNLRTRAAAHEASDHGKCWTFPD